MIYIALSVASSTAILLLFKWFQKAHINTRHAIVVNYAVASIAGFFFFDVSTDIFQSAWFILAAMLGIVFYAGFRLIAKTTQTVGVSAASIATKMSVIIPVLVGLTLLQESSGVLKIIGIAIGLFSVLVSSKLTEGIRSWFWPLLTFLVSGAIDTCLNLFQLTLVSEEMFPALISTIFGFAFIAGSVHFIFLPEKRIGVMTLIGGSALGIVNFGSLIFILMALSLPNWESSVVFPINNVGVVAASTALAFIIFKEKVTVKNALGIALALASIYLLYLSQ